MHHNDPAGDPGPAGDGTDPGDACWIWARPAAPGCAIAIDAVTGLPAALSRGGSLQPLRSSVTVVCGGRERRGTYGGIDVTDTVEFHDSAYVRHGPAAAPPPDAGPGGAVDVVTHVGPVDLTWSVAFRDGEPSVAVTMSVTAREPGEVVVRDVRLSITAAVDGVDATDPVVRAPGNRIRSDLPLAELDTPVTVNTAGGTPGSSGMILLEHVRRPQTLLCWPLSRDAIGQHAIRREPGGLVIDLHTGLAGVTGAPGPDGTPRYGPILLDLIGERWEAIRERIPHWYPDLGVDLPHDAPGWIHQASIFEVQLGTSLFGPPANYSPYPTVGDLIGDLPRISYLGFDTIQVMPRQPFPSYNVIDFADIGASYGDPEELRDLVRRAHDLGIRVILDVIMHGVIDKESIGQAADAVRSGPHGRYLATPEAFTGEGAASLPAADRLPWSRHILDFERAWSDGSPAVHPLVTDHPDWFFRDSRGHVAGIYTKAFDLGHPEFQRYFEDALISFVERLGVDGFRFDAPTYNAFPNWSTLTRHRASASELACIDLFAALRARLKPRFPDLLFYTEPSGVLLRQSMDVNYNYDEHSQLEDLVGFRGVALGSAGESTAGIRSADELAAWFDDRNACLPARAVTAHHIDSHDTFWWPRPGQKWRREQVAGTAAAAALASIFALSGGPYMTFVGGELGIEEHLRRIHRLRARPEIAHGTADYRSVRTDAPSVYAVVRAANDAASLVLVNMSDRGVTAAITLSPFTIAADRAGAGAGAAASARVTDGTTSWATNLLDGAPVALPGGRRPRLVLPAHATVVLALHTPEGEANA